MRQGSGITRLISAAVVLLVLIAARNTAATGRDEAAGLPWPEGWSRPAESLTTQRSWGPLAVQRVDDHVVAVGAHGTDLLFIARLGLSGEVLAESTWDIPVDGHLLSHLRIAVGADRVNHVIWQERRPGSTAIRYARLNGDFAVEIPGSVAVKSTRTLGMGNLVFNVQGQPVMLWSESVDGPEDIFMGEVDRDGLVSTRVLLTDTSFRDTRPNAVFHPDGHVHVTWTRREYDTNWLYYRAFGADGTPLGDEQRLGLIAVGRFRDPHMLIDPSGSVHVFWSGTGGAAGGAFQNHVTLSADGSVCSPVTALVSGRAAMEQPSVVWMDDEIHMAWAQQVQGVTQVFYESLSAEGLLEETRTAGSRLTISSRGSFEPALWLDGDGYPHVLLHRIGDLDRGHLLEVHVMNQRYPEGPSIWYSLGYEEGGALTTLISVVYLQVQTLALAALGAFSSFAAMVAAYLAVGVLRRMGVFSESTWGKRLQILALLAAVWLLKDPATIIYANPVMVGPLYSWLVFAAGAAGVFLLMRWRQLPADDELTVILGLVLFMVWEYYYSGLPMLSRFS